MELQKKIINELYEQNTNLVYYVYNTMIVKSDLIRRNKEDIIQEGLVGLWKACLKYDPKTNNKFSTYAISIVKFTMLKFVYDLININNNEIGFEVKSNKDHKDKDESLNLENVICKNKDEFAEVETEIFIEQILINFPKQYAVVIAMKKQGKSQQEIAKRINVSQMEVSRILKRIKKEFKRQISE